MAKTNFVDEFIANAKESTDGIHAVTVVEIESGMTLGNFSDGSIDPEVASAYNVEVVKSKLKAVSALGLSDSIDDILITLTTQYHLISCTENGTHMIYPRIKTHFHDGSFSRFPKFHIKGLDVFFQVRSC